MANKPPERGSSRSRARNKRRDPEGPEEEQGQPEVSPPVPRQPPQGHPEGDAERPVNAETLGDYVVVARLGGGGMADVFLAHKMSRFGFVRRAVIKRVRRARPGYKNLQRMLLDEARATACFDHPNIVQILDVGEDGEGVYLALEYVEGTDLRWVNNKLRARKEALPFELACHVCVEVLRGLHHAHTVRGSDGEPLEIVHRDVNPSNVLISYSGHVKLADFGVVRMRDRVQQETEAGLVKGKYAYLAPEYIAGESCTHLSDIYATGIMLFELLSGRECFSGTTTYEVMWKIVNRGVPMYRLEREGVPEDLCRIIQRATNPVPERRFASAQEMANALETWLMRSGKHATPWVLSVFFSRHELFPSREEMAANQVVPGLARSVHAVGREMREADRAWSEPTPQQGEYPRHRDVVTDPTPAPQLEMPPAYEPGRAEDDERRAGFGPPSSEGLHASEDQTQRLQAIQMPRPPAPGQAERAASEASGEAGRRIYSADNRPGPQAPSRSMPPPSSLMPPSSEDAFSLPAIDMQQAMQEGLRFNFAPEPEREAAPPPPPRQPPPPRVRESIPPPSVQREAAPPDQRPTMPVISWPEDAARSASSRRDEFAERVTPVPEAAMRVSAAHARPPPPQPQVSLEAPPPRMPPPSRSQPGQSAQPAGADLPIAAPASLPSSPFTPARMPPPPRPPILPPSANMPPPSASMPPLSANMPPPSANMPPPSANMPPPSANMPPPSANMLPPSATMPPLAPSSSQQGIPLPKAPEPQPRAETSRRQPSPIGIPVPKGSSNPMPSIPPRTPSRVPAPITAHSGRTPPPSAQPPVSTSLAAPPSPRPSTTPASTMPPIAPPFQPPNARQITPSTSSSDTYPPIPMPQPQVMPATLQPHPTLPPIAPPSADLMIGPPSAAPAPIPQDFYPTDGPLNVTPSPDVRIEEPEDTLDGPPPDADTDMESAKTPAPAPSEDGPRGTVLWSGKLEETSAAEALDQLTRAGASGTLEYRCGLIWKRVQLDQGTPIAITSNMGMELIGEHLVKARLLSRRELDRALHAAERDGQPLTTKLLELGMIEKPRLEEELGKNLSARLSEALEWRWGTFEFTPQPPEVAAIRPRLDLQAIIQGAVEARARADSEEPGPEDGKSDSDQSRLKEAFKRARSIAQSTGKGRVEDLGSPRPSKR